jgi:hypothetical protein
MMRAVALAKNEQGLPGLGVEFYKVSDGASFKAFLRPGWQGFARDLFIDYVRWTYHKGSIAYPDPREFGLTQFERDRLFLDMFPEYEQRIRETFELTKRLLGAGETAARKQEEQRDG